MIRYLLASLREFWDGFRWDTADCGCAFTVTGPARVRTCSVHTWAQERIAEEVGGRR